MSCNSEEGSGDGSNLEDSQGLSNLLSALDAPTGTSALTQDEPSQVATATESEITSVFLDAEVSGLEVLVGDRSVLTDQRGNFPCTAGEEILFHLGGVILGKTECLNIITPLHFDLPEGLDLSTLSFADLEGDELPFEITPAVLNRIRVLLTLDDNDHWADGIQINEKIRELAATTNFNFDNLEPLFQTNSEATDTTTDTTTDTDTDTESSFLLEEHPVVQSFISNVTLHRTAGERSLVSEEEALAHFKQTLMRIAAGEWSEEDTTNPIVTDSNLETAAAFFPGGSPIRVHFSETMVASVFNESSVLLTDAETAEPIEARLAYQGVTLHIIPEESLLLGKEYELVILGGIDLSGNALEPAFVKQFSLPAIPENQFNLITSVTPENGAPSVSLDLIEENGIQIQLADNISPEWMTWLEAGELSASMEPPVEGDLDYELNTLVWRPLAPLEHETHYTLTLQFRSSEQRHDIHFRTAEAPHIIPPYVIPGGVPPDAQSRNVSITDPSISIIFSRALDPNTLTADNIQLFEEGEAIAIVFPVSYDAVTNTLSITPLVMPLKESSSYEVRIGTGVTDTAGHPLMDEFRWSFTTEDVTPPRVTPIFPPPNAVNVAQNAEIVVEISEPLFITTFHTLIAYEFAEIHDFIKVEQLNVPGDTIGEPTTVIRGFVDPTTENRLSWRIAPFFLEEGELPLFQEKTRYRATISSGHIIDLSNNHSEQEASELSWEFTTGDFTAPIPVTQIPEALATDVDVNTEIEITFDDALLASSVQPDSMQLFEMGPNDTLTPLPTTTSYDALAKMLFLQLSNNAELKEQSTYQVKVNSGLLDDTPQQHPLSEQVWEFTTGDFTAPSVLAVQPADGTSSLKNLQPTISIQFSEDMSAESLNLDHIQLFNEDNLTAPIATSLVSKNEDSFQFQPTANLLEGHRYVVMVSPILTDLAGLSLVTNAPSGYRWEFRTADQTAPVAGTPSIADGATRVATNAAIEIPLSEPILESSMASAFQMNKSDGTPVLGSLDFIASSRLLRFTPNSALAEKTRYRVQLDQHLVDASLEANALQNIVVFSFTTEDTKPPELLRTTPQAGDASVAENPQIQLVFSEEVVVAGHIALLDSLENDILGNQVGDADSSVPGEVALRFEVNQALTEKSQYTLRLSGGIEDLFQNSILLPNQGQQYDIAFTSGDFQNPLILSRTPDFGATRVGKESHITVSFNETMKESMLIDDALVVTGPSGALTDVTLTYDPQNFSLTLAPNTDLESEAVYTVNLVPEKVADLSGKALADSEVTQWSFTTVDYIRPTVTQVTTAEGNAGVSINPVFEVHFSEAISENTLFPNIRLLDASNHDVHAQWTALPQSNNPSFFFSPDIPLDDLSSYTLELSNLIQDTAGNALDSQDALSPLVQFTFTTEDKTPPTVALVNPVSGATNVAAGTTIELLFDEPVSPFENNPMNVRLRGNDGSTSQGVVSSFDGQTLLVQPGTLSNRGVKYCIEFGTAIVDDSNNFLGGANTSAFLTEECFTAADTQRPMIVSKSPTGQNVALNASFEIIVDEALDPTTVLPGNIEVSDVIYTSSSLSLSSYLNKHNLVYDEAQNKITFSMVTDFASDTVHRVNLNGITDLSGNRLLATWTFNTEDHIAPELAPDNPFTPSDEDSGILETIAQMSVSLNEPLDPNTINTNSVRLEDSTGASHPGTVTYVESLGFNSDTHLDDSIQIIFTPQAGTVLKSNERYSVIVDQTITDTSGNSLQNPISWEFTTTDTQAPFLVSSTPGNQQTSGVNPTIEFVFNEDIANVTSTSGSGAGLDLSMHTIDNKSVQFNVTSPLTIGEKYSVSIVVEDTAGFSSETHTISWIPGQWHHSKSIYHPREKAAILTFNDKIWIIGGTHPDFGNFDDVWSSEDGMNWTQEAQQAPFGAQVEPIVVEFNNELWLLNDDKIWSSPDGRIWTEEASQLLSMLPFGTTLSPNNQKVAVFDNKLWVLDGEWFSGVQTLLHSEDGITWNQTDIFHSNFYSDLLTFDNKLWLHSRLTGFWSTSANNPGFPQWTQAAGSPTSSTLNRLVSLPKDGVEALWDISGSSSGVSTVRYSHDTITWTSIPFDDTLSIKNYTPIAFNNKLWIFNPKRNTSNAAALPTNWAWNSSDGIHWSHPNESFPQRFSHTSVVFNDKIWNIGGQSDASTLLGDVWSSEDGFTWSEENSNANFSARSEHTSVVFDNKMWVIGGESADGLNNDVWSSEDGINWTQVTSNAAFTARSKHTSTVFDNKMWVIGGESAGGLNNDVWSSEDGVSWTQVTAAADFSERADHGLATFQGKMWLMGGLGNGFIEDHSLTSFPAGIDVYILQGGDFIQVFNIAELFQGGVYHPPHKYDAAALRDIWSSSDGITWVLENDPTVALAADTLLSYQQHTFIASDEHLWAVGGRAVNNFTRYMSQYSTDGEHWEIIGIQQFVSPNVTIGTGYQRSYNHTSVIFNDHIWLLGGQNTNNQSHRYTLRLPLP